jgi:peptidoglycan/LPS O-acetylase OafA/YrhL
MLLGIAFHLTYFWGWHAPIPQSVSPATTWFTTLSHAFRMPLFYLVAGFFGALLLARGGARAFVRHRLKRIGLPLAVGLVTVAPATSVLLALAPRHPAGVGDLTVGDYTNPQHLWFLWYLLLLYALTLGVRALLERLGRTGAVEGTRATLVRVLSWRTALLPLAAAAAVLNIATTAIESGVGGSIWADASLLGYYGSFFAVGWLLFARREEIGVLARRPLGYAALAAGAAVPLAELAPVQSEPTDFGALETYAALSLSALVAWSAILALFGIAERWLSVDRPAVRYVTDSSYWMYLAHMPVLLVVVPAVLATGVPFTLAYLASLAIVAALLLGSYAAFVRHTAIGRVLHGPRPRAAGRRAATASTQPVSDRT